MQLPMRRGRLALRYGSAANRGVITWDEAIVLVEELQRLRSELASKEARLVELDRLAHRDALVDLANRRSFFAALERLIGRVERSSVGAAMVFVDVDGLKAINDILGHNAGDQALMEVSRLLVASVRKGDFVARLAGDEFGILLEPADELNAWEAALRVVETVDESEFCLNGACLPLSVAVGVTMIRAGDTPEAVLARADKEMYRIKAIGGAKPAPSRPSV